jgi:hypothetical protein
MIIVIGKYHLLLSYISIFTPSPAHSSTRLSSFVSRHTSAPHCLYIINYFWYRKVLFTIIITTHLRSALSLYKKLFLTQESIIYYYNYDTPPLRTVSSWGCRRRSLSLSPPRPPGGSGGGSGWGGGMLLHVQSLLLKSRICISVKRTLV